jgi:FkbM family methyltransferase
LEKQQMQNAKLAVEPSCSQRKYWKNRFKDLVREMMPAHLRFIRIGRRFMSSGEHEAALLQGLVESGSSVIDVGANIGQFTYALCQLVGPSGNVIAIEPQPELAKLLRAATRHLSLPVTVFECALSSRTGEAQLEIPVINGEKRHALATLNGHGASGFHKQVKLCRLDDICRQIRTRISLIKIDVEGHELEVLLGSVDTLRRHRPVLLMEIEQRHSPVPIGETFDFLKSLGYCGEFVDANGRCQPQLCFDVTEHQTRHLDAIGSPEYINTFVFRAPAPLENVPSIQP